MRPSLPSLFFAAATLLLGCGASDAGATSAGGGAGSATTTTDTAQGGTSDGGSTITTTTDTTTSSNGGGTSSGSGGAGGGAPVTCDAIGACGNTGDGCVGCAVAGPCLAAYEACFASTDCVKLQQCLTTCAADALCEAACEQQIPAGKAPFDAFAQCVLCDECPISCGPSPTCP